MSDSVFQGYPDYFSRSQFPTEGYEKIQAFAHHRIVGATSTKLYTFTANAIITKMWIYYLNPTIGDSYNLALAGYDGVNDIGSQARIDEIIDKSKTLSSRGLFDVTKIENDLSGIALELVNPLFVFPLTELNVWDYTSTDDYTYITMLVKELEK